MNCYYCGAYLDSMDTCPNCEADVKIWKKIVSISNKLYNDGLERAQVRDLSGAVEYLKMSLRYNKMNTNARNLLGLVYFEMGESVKALSEWVISKSLQGEDNPATAYLADIQKSSARLDNLNQTIKKFNQSLTYCKDGNTDLALIQLKKVLALNPKLVKGHQLLALLYMKEERYDLALRALKNAEKIDVGDANTMRYKKECHEHLKANGKVKTKEKDTVSYQSGNDLIIRPAKFTDNTAVLTVVNLLVGAAIGIAVVCFLIVPGIRKNANTNAASQLVKANETIATREQSIKSLEDEISSLQQTVADAQTETSSAGEKNTSYEALLNAYVAYAAKENVKAGESLANVNRDLLSENAQQIYDNMMTDVKSAMLEADMNEALDLYEKNNYSEAITKFESIVQTDEGYQEGKAAYYLAFAYNYQKDESNALKWFQIAKNHTNSSSVRNTCKEMIDDMQSRGITVPDASGSTGTQAGGTPDGSAADNTTADNSDNNTDNE